MQLTAASTNALRPAPNESSTTSSAVTWISQRLQAGELSKPGPEFDDFTRKLMLGLWLETLAEIGAERFDAAFKQVLRSSPYRPDISEIRKAAGVNNGLSDPREKQAISALGNVLGIMREFGPKLLSKPGKLVREIAEDGTVQSKAMPDTPPPALCAKTEATLAHCGSGSREGGLTLLAGHPALPWNAVDVRNEEPRERSFRLKAVVEIEKRWVAAWVGAR